MKPCFSKTFCTLYGGTKCFDPNCSIYEIWIENAKQNEWETIVELYKNGQISKEELEDPNISLDKIISRIFENEVLTDLSEEE